MAPVNPEQGQTSILKEVVDLQSSMYDKASTYTKIIVGLGYGGFFTAWSGTKDHLSPKIMVASALFEIVSLVLFVFYEIWGAMVISHLSLDFAEAVNGPAPDIAAALQAHRKNAIKVTRPLLKAWKFVFSVSAITGLLGGLILIYAFVAGLFRMCSSIPR